MIFLPVVHPDKRWGEVGPLLEDVKHHDAQGPDVGFGRQLLLIRLRGSVRLRDHVSTGRVKGTDLSKIGQVKPPLTIKQYVCRLDVSVGHTFLRQESQDLQYGLGPY